MEGFLRIFNDFFIEWGFATQRFINILYFLISVLTLVGVIAWRMGRRRVYIEENYYAPNSDALLQTLKVKVDRVKCLLLCITFLSACYLGCLGLISAFYLEPTANWIKNKIQTKHSLGIDFKYVTGSLLKGQYIIHDLHLVKRIENRQFFDIRIPTVKFTVSAWPFGARQFDKLAIEGLQAYIDVNVFDKLNKHSRPTYTDNYSRQLVINKYSVRKSNLLLRYGVREKAHFVIEDLQGENYASEDPLFRILFGTTMHATLNGKAFITKHHSHEAANISDWSFEAIPAFWLKDTLVKMPFNWFDRGQVGLIATSHWNEGGTMRVQTRWVVRVDKVELKSRSALSLDEQLLMIASQRYLHKQKYPFEMTFNTLFENHKPRRAKGPFSERFATTIFDSLTALLKQGIG